MPKRAILSIYDKRGLACKAFAHTDAYDEAIRAYFEGQGYAVL